MSAQLLTAWTATPSPVQAVGAFPTSIDALTAPNAVPGMALAFPTIAGERLAGLEDIGLRLPQSLLLLNDSTQSLSALHIASVGHARHGQVALRQVESAPGVFTLEVVFIPDADFHGEAGFSYTVSDRFGLQATGWATLEIAAVNDAPLTAGEALQSLEDAGLLFAPGQLLANDRDPDIPTNGDSLRISRVGLAAHGTVWLGGDGGIRFLPDADYHGAAGFTYWVADEAGLETAAAVSIAIAPANDLPVAGGEELHGGEDAVLGIDPAHLLANDRDADTLTDGQVLRIGAVGAARHGSVFLLPDGRIGFVPEPDFNGLASFSYTVDDGAGGTATALAIVRLAAVNDAPQVTGETIALDEDHILAIAPSALLANDSDIDSPRGDLRIVAVDNASHGSVTLDAGGAIRYVPDADYSGTASFTYTVSDGDSGFTVGTALLEIQPVNDAPRLRGEAASADEDQVVRLDIAALLANDADPDNPHGDLHILSVADAAHGEVRIEAGTIVFTPTLNHSGDTGFSYTVSDGAGGLSQAVVRLTFNPVNDAPVVNGEFIDGKRGVTYTFSQAALLANDTDAESPAGLRIVGVQNAEHGTVRLAASGAVVFAPDAGYTGKGSFEYLVQDADGAQRTGRTEIDFSRINITPTATDDSFTGYEDTAFIIQAAQLLANDGDADSVAGQAPMAIDAVANASHGSVTLQAGGSIRFDPEADFHGNASFQYRVSDAEGASAWATAFLAVASVNDAPVIEDIWYGTPVYGYQLFSQGSGRDKATWDEAVHDEALALRLASRGELHDKVLVPPTSHGDAAHADFYEYPLASVSYYLNGHLKPLRIETADAVMPLRSDGDTLILPTPVDDLYREHGKVIAWDPDGDSSLITLAVADGPQHGHAWANIKTPDGVRIYTTHAAAQDSFVPESGAWQYYSHYGDPYTGNDPFTVQVTDGEGASTAAMIQTSHEGLSAGGGGMCPIVIDLRGDGIQLLRPEDSMVFADVNHDGWHERIGWASPDDGVLTFDADSDGLITREAEVSFVGYRPGAQTDLDGLAAFDTDEDGQLSAADAAWAQFGVLRDANANGRQDDGELVPLGALGITSIGLQRGGSAHLNNGNVVFGTAVVGYADGHTGVAADVMFAGEGVALPGAAIERLAQAGAADVPATPAGQAMTAPDDQARIMQMALVFNQYCNTGDAAAQPLGFVPWADAGAAVHADAMAALPFGQPPGLADMQQFAAAAHGQNAQGTS